MSKKLLLRSFLSPGDIVMLTAAVRDLHLGHPGKFITDVRTSCAELWENNPWITPLPENDPEAEVIDCSYPLIDRSNTLPYHSLHGYMQFLSARLGVEIKPTQFRGDIHLSELEKSWFSQVRELAGEDIPFWVLPAGGKYDVTIKWWDMARYQKVIDHFRGRIQFVHVGALGHFHPRLKGVIDLRGRTSLRQLVRLIYHAQGALCPVTAVMHLSAAIEVKERPRASRPCVVIAGGREPAHWEAYPDHQFISTNGALRCCSNGGCWKARTTPIGDGDERDQPGHLCLDVRNGLPRCMDMISAEEVIRRIECYFEGGAAEHLTPAQARAARRAVKASEDNDYDNGPLTLHNSRLACESFIRRLPPRPAFPRQRGIVICGGGFRYFACAWVCIRRLRDLGCALPIQLWHLGSGEMDDDMRALVRPWDVECVDAREAEKLNPARRLGGWELKPYAILHSPFQEVLFLDADNVPARNPEYLFETPQYRQTGAIFWPDYGRFPNTHVIWANCGLAQPDGPEVESGQIIVDKARCWEALSLAMWFNEQSDFYYQYLHGDKETFRLAFHKLKKSYGWIDAPAHPLAGTMCQHDFEGNRVFQHRNTDKWSLFLNNWTVPGFQFEEECRAHLRDLQSRWDGRLSLYQSRDQKSPRAASPARIAAVMISCPERAALREQTLENLAATDWGGEPVLLQVDRAEHECREIRQTVTALLALQSALRTPADYILFLEDDLGFNRHFRRNLDSWALLQNGEIALASLCNLGLPMLAGHPAARCFVTPPHTFFGSQALLLSRRAAKYIVAHWDEVEGKQDIKISRLAGRLGQPIFCHAPSLVQHLGIESTWGGAPHHARDFDPGWKA